MYPFSLSTVKDADQIYVMGDGQVLEHGTHAQLLADPEGPYARLVQAQKLREAEHRGDSEDEGADAKTKAGAMEAAAAQEQPLGRARSHSVASEILEQRRKEQGSVKERRYGTRDMFKRMRTINREAVPLYITGFMAAACTGMVYPAFGIVYAQAIQDFQMTGHELRVAGESNICLRSSVGLIFFYGQPTAVRSGSSSLLSARQSASPSKITCSTEPPRA